MRKSAVSCSCYSTGWPLAAVVWDVQKAADEWLLWPSTSLLSHRPHSSYITAENTCSQTAKYHTLACSFQTDYDLNIMQVMKGKVPSSRIEDLFDNLDFHAHLFIQQHFTVTISSSKNNNNNNNNNIYKSTIKLFIEFIICKTSRAI